MTELNEAAFPKTGRVNEVCREWLVREDNALAQQLQSQEINDHYRGNRYRNQVVRQDFPTALSEQIKEKEEADQQAALYHQMLNAQTEADGIVARQVADKLRREQELERRRNIEQSEYLARHLQDDLVVHVKHTSPVPPPPPPSSASSSSRMQQQAFPSPSEPIVNELPIPPKNLGIKFNGQHRRNYNECDLVTNPSYVTAAPTPSAHVRDSPQLNYVSLELNIPKDSQRLANHHATQYTQVFAHNPSTPPGPLSPSDSDNHHYEHINLHSHTPEKKATSQHVQRDYSFPAPPEAVGLPPKPNKQPQISPSKAMSSKQYELPKLPPKVGKDVSPKNRSLQMLTTDSFDMMMGNRNSCEIPDECDSLAVGGVDPKLNTERVFNSNTPNINRIDSVNDILNYDDAAAEEAIGSASCSDRIRQLQELGVPADEILEIDRRLTQQEKDEELARRLQEEEGQVRMTQEEKDRMVAIEAQDKELARMLQEREKAKARRAKERARARKQQLQQEKIQQEASVEAVQYVENSSAASAASHSRSHSDSNDIEHDSYSDPIDLINARENAKQSYQAGEYYHSKQSSGASRDSFFNSDENYSNPVDSLRNAAAISDLNHNASPPRPSKKQSSKQPRPISTESLDNVEHSYPNSSSSGQNNAAPMPSNESQNFLPAHLKYTTPDQNSNPIPPYMPIQGVRRNGNVQVDKKKKPKDNRCIHQ